MASTAIAREGEARSFYFWMAGAFMLIAFGGFFPTYWLRVARGTFDMPRIVHVHGLIFFAWTLYYFAQTALVSAGRTLDHRRWGLAGIALFSVMMCTIVAAQVAMMNLHERNGFGAAGRQFAAVSLVGLPVVATMFALAIRNTTKPELHKRLMILVMVMFMHPAIARVFVAAIVGVEPAGALPSPPPPAMFSVPPGLVADLLIVIAMVRDRRVEGRVHPVYIWGGLAILAEQILVAPISTTAIWDRIALGVQHLIV